MIPNSTQVPNEFIDEWLPILSGTAFKILLIITRQTLGWIQDQLTGMRKEEDWLNYSQLMEQAGLERQTISNGLKELYDHGLIEARDSIGNPLATKEDRQGKKLFYRLATSLKTRLVDDNQSKNQTGLTKEKEIDKEINKESNKENNKEIDKEKERFPTSKKLAVGMGVQKHPSCPLLNGSPLKARYPDGHNECAEYFISVEERRNQKFINKSKQFDYIHKILRAGYGFDEMNTAFPKVEKKYGHGNWDFSTLAAWLEKGASNG